MISREQSEAFFSYAERACAPYKRCSWALCRAVRRVARADGGTGGRVRLQLRVYTHRSSDGGADGGADGGTYLRAVAAAGGVDVDDQSRFDDHQSLFDDHQTHSASADAVAFVAAYA